jgi:1-acyl-sn-glycerol-3-phosphate acyltransferase
MRTISGVASTVRRYVIAYVGLLSLGLICLAWSVIALPAYFLLPPRSGAAFGRAGISRGFYLYRLIIVAIGTFRLDLSEVETLRNESGLILAPNHPQMIDAILLATCHTNIVCVMKAPLMRNIFLGAGSRLARYIANEPPRRMIESAVAALKDGGMLLLFPEGTRSVRFPISDFHLSVAAISKHANVPVQTLIIECDSPYLSKGWPLFRIPQFPIAFKVRLGRRFEPPTDARAFTRELEIYFCQELAHSLQRGWQTERQGERLG